MQTQSASLESVQVILPKQNADALLEQQKELPFVFLIGPVLGGGDWQLLMLKELASHIPTFAAAVPCRWQPHHRDVFSYGVAGEPGKFTRQLAWEQHYIQKALSRKKSCVICFLKEEALHDPRQDGNPYGRDTYGEIGYFRGLFRYDRSLRFVIGADPAFRGLDVIQRNFDYTIRSSALDTTGKIKTGFCIHLDMQSTVEAALPFLT